MDQETLAELRKLSDKMQQCNEPETLRQLTEQFYMLAGGGHAKEKFHGEAPNTRRPFLRVVVDNTKDLAR